jgi:glucan endo-1,3-alpha-glucosidase
VQFNSGWPIALTTSSAAATLSSVGGGLTLAASASSQQKVSQALSKFIGATDTDTQHVNALAASAGGKKKTYMAAISPWFFTHYSPDTFNKNVRIHLPSLLRSQNHY